MDYNVCRHVNEFRINGFTVFEELIPHEKIDRIHEAWVPVRNASIRVQSEHPPRGWGRFNVPVSFHPPFVDVDIFEHPGLIAFFERVLGPDYVWSHFDSNIPLSGTDYQSWHRDGAASPFPNLMTPAFTIGCKFHLVDTKKKMGALRSSRAANTCIAISIVKR